MTTKTAADPSATAFSPEQKDELAAVLSAALTKSNDLMMANLAARDAALAASIKHDLIGEAAKFGFNPPTAPPPTAAPTASIAEEPVTKKFMMEMFDQKLTPIRREISGLRSRMQNSEAAADSHSEALAAAQKKNREALNEIARINQERHAESLRAVTQEAAFIVSEANAAKTAALLEEFKLSSTSAERKQAIVDEMARLQMASAPHRMASAAEETSQPTKEAVPIIQHGLVGAAGGVAGAACAGAMALGGPWLWGAGLVAAAVTAGLSVLYSRDQKEKLSGANA